MAETSNGGIMRYSELVRVSTGYSPWFTCPACEGHEYAAWWKDGEHRKCKWCSQAKVDAASSKDRSK